ncbi:MAG: DNA-binding protein YbiB, partial [Rubrivivax sp.]|nr:DNA-binding protein YbiB [Rubrivivax sp.]
QPRVDTSLAGKLHPELSLAAQEGVLTELPLLPRETDAASTAVYVQEVLSGMRPVPPPLAHQASQIIASVKLLRQRLPVGKTA